MSAQSPARWRSYLKVALAILAIAGLIALGRFAGGWLPDIKESVGRLGVWGPLAFILGYAVATVAFIPGSVLTLGAGAVFGLWRGVVYTFLGATLGAAAAFLVSRHFARGFIEKKIAENPRFAAIDRAVAADGRRIVFLLRLSPLFPFNLLNYALGLTKVRFIDYFVASMGMLPGTLLYVYYGSLGGDVAAAAGGTGVPGMASPPGSSAPVGHAPAGTAGLVLKIAGLVATVVVTTIVTRTARRALRQATGE